MKIKEIDVIYRYSRERCVFLGVYNSDLLKLTHRLHVPARHLGETTTTTTIATKPENLIICYGSCEKHSELCGICGLLFRDTVLFFSLSNSGQGYMLEGCIVEPDGSQPKRITFPRTPLVK